MPTSFSRHFWFLAGFDRHKDKPFLHYVSLTGAELVYISGQEGDDASGSVSALTFHFYGQRNPPAIIDDPLKGQAKPKG